MIRISNSKLMILLVGCLVSIGLLIGLVVTLPQGVSSADGTPTLPAHSRERTANISLSPHLSWELELYGSGSEQLVASFVEGGLLYVFGNTDSGDLDFDRAGIFLNITDTYGVIKAFFVYGEENEVLKSATVCEGGFLLAVETQNCPKLLFIDTFGELKSTISGFFNGFEKVLDVKRYSSDGGGYIMFSQATNNLSGVRTLRCSFFSNTLEYITSRIAVSPYSLDLYDSVVVSGRPIAVCNAVSSLHTLPALVEFSRTAPAKIGVLLGNPGTVVGMGLYLGDLLLLTTEGGSSYLKVSTAGVIDSKTTLSQYDAKYFSIVGAYKNDQTPRYLAFADQTTMLTLGNGTRVSTFEGFTPFCHAYLTDMTMFAGDSRGKLLINVYSDTKLTYQANLGKGARPILALDPNNQFCIFENNGNIQITKLRTPIFL